jgi:hypothetical protein
LLILTPPAVPFGQGVVEAAERSPVPTLQLDDERRGVERLRGAS